jgi:uncharacterized protein (DUF983 family)
MRPPGREGVITAAIAREVSACLVILRLLTISVAAFVWTGLIAGCLAWLSIPLWVLVIGRALAIGAVHPIPETAAYRREA